MICIVVYLYKKCALDELGMYTMCASGVIKVHLAFSGVARAYPGGRATHRGTKIEEENEQKLSRNGRK